MKEYEIRFWEKSDKSRDKDTRDIRYVQANSMEEARRRFLAKNKSYTIGEMRWNR